jgi:sugar/nucleoside kinase (ribokinase family)
MSEVWTMGEMLVEIMRPRAGMELYAPGEFIGPFPSGAPAIFIDAVARLGHSAGIFGGVGADDFGKCILDRLQKDGVDTRYVYEDESGSTAVAFVTYFEDGSRKFIYHIGNTPAVKVKEFSLQDIQNPRFFHIMGCSLMASDAFKTKILETAFAFANAGAKISFDPNIRAELLMGRDVDTIVGAVLKNCSVIMPGIEELKMLTGAEDIETGITRLFRYEKMEMIALKRGSRGATLYTRKEKVDCPSFPVRQVDPTGAGDCFDAALLCGILEGRPLKEIGCMANAAGALNVMGFGPMEGDISVTAVEDMMRHE